MESEKKKKSSENNAEAIRKFLDTYFQGWYQAKIDEYINNAGDSFKDAFESYIDNDNDLLMHSVREEYKREATSLHW